MADPTNAELQAEVQRLAQQIVQLPTKAQIDNLLASVNDYKSTTTTLITQLTSRVEKLEATVNDLVTRVQTLEEA